MPPLSARAQNFFQNSLDICGLVCYTIVTKRKGGASMKKAIKRWRFCRWMGMPFGKCIKAFLFGKDVFKCG